MMSAQARRLDGCVLGREEHKGEKEYMPTMTIPEMRTEAVAYSRDYQIGPMTLLFA
jgi:hypothetical protein